MTAETWNGYEIEGKTVSSKGIWRGFVRPGGGKKSISLIKVPGEKWKPLRGAALMVEQEESD